MNNGLAHHGIFSKVKIIMNYVSHTILWRKDINSILSKEIINFWIELRLN